MDRHINLLDFPNEILLIIFEKLEMIDALYSLVDVNRRFDRLVLGSLDIHDLDMTKGITVDSMHKQTLQVDSQVLSRICEQILPRICHRVQKLTIKKHSMQRILFATNYPQLYSLSLVNFQEDTLHQHLTGMMAIIVRVKKRIALIILFCLRIVDDLDFRDLLVKQITHLDVYMEGTTESISTTAAEIFPLVLASCEKLIVLNIGGICSGRACWNPLYLQTRNGMSSTLIQLKINIENFVDCLYLLDGRLPCLSTLEVKMSHIKDPVEDIGEKVSVISVDHFRKEKFLRLAYRENFLN